MKIPISLQFFSVFMLFFLPSMATGQTWDLVFSPDPGIRVDSVSIQTILIQENIFYLSFADGPNSGLSISSDGLSFTRISPSLYPDYKYHTLPDGTFRKYLVNFVDGKFRLTSGSSTDGVLFVPDPGYRYTFLPNDSVSSLPVYTSVTNNALGGILLVYLAGGRLDNARSAYSIPGNNGWDFTEYRTNIFADLILGGKNQSYWDPHSLLMHDGRNRVTTMNQHGPPVPSAVPKGTIYTLTSMDHGLTFAQDPFYRLRYDSFTQYQVYSLNDPRMIRLPDGRYRMTLRR